MAEADVISLDDYRPQVRVMTDAGELVIPNALVEAMIEGRIELDAVDDWKPMLRTVLKEWYENIRK